MWSALKTQPRTLGLVSYSLFLLPLSLAVTLFALLLRRAGLISLPAVAPKTNHGKQIRVLVTGVGMAKGLFLCRSFYLGGCHVVGADFDKPNSIRNGKFSKAINKYCALPDPSKDAKRYISEVVELVVIEKIDLCITCSGVATAVEDAQMAAHVERVTSCKVFQFSEDIIRTLDDKMEFMKQTAEIGAAHPQWFDITSPGDIEAVLDHLCVSKASTQSARYIVKSAGMDDASRGNIPLIDPSDYQHMSETLRSLNVRDGHKWILQEYLPGDEEYCTHAVVVKGQVLAYTACPSSSVLLHYKLLDPSSVFYQHMLEYTQRYASALQDKFGEFTGHLSFDFRIRPTSSDSGQLVPIECNPRCHTATVMFRGHEKRLTEAYLTCIGGEAGMKPLECSRGGYSYYWMGHDMAVNLALPLFQLLADPQMAFRTGFKSLPELAKHLIAWKDPTFEWWDPMPWFVLYHVYWPLILVGLSFRGTSWKQLNVSTTKVFHS